MSQHDGEPFTDKEHQSLQTASVINVELLRRLVRLLDHSDVSELELKRAEEGTRLVLRKARASGLNVQQPGTIQQAQLTDVPVVAPSSVAAVPAVETKHTIVAHLVGIFHAWAKPKGGALVAPGDRVKAGQLVATIESLNVINEVEAPVAGHVVELLVQEGQPVEYGQPLMVIDSSDGEKRI